MREVPPVTFVGGTGRSGTHVVSQLLTSHGKLHLIPVECRFHVDEDGFPGLLGGHVTKEAFIRRLRGFWWKGFQTNRMRGMYRFVPRERFDEAVDVLRRRASTTTPSGRASTSSATCCGPSRPRAR